MRVNRRIYIGKDRTKLEKLKIEIEYIVVIFLLFLIQNCASLGSYSKDRGKDAMDVVDVTVGFTFLKAHAKVSDVNLGLNFFYGGVGLKNGEIGNNFNTCVVFLIGTPCSIKKENEEYLTFDAEDMRRIDYRNKLATSESPRPVSKYTQVTLGIGFLIGAEVTFNAGELADFFLGIIGADLYSDDYYSYKRKIEKDDLLKDEK